MRTVETTIYRCSFCGKIYLRQSWCEKHEPNCKKNPKNAQRCFEGCIYIDAKEIVFSDQNLTEYETISRRGFFCSQKECFVYPFWCNSPILEEDIVDETPNEPMPKECELFYNKY